MSKMLNIIKERRSIRKYEDREISDDVLNKLFEAVQWSPSWANTQCWELIVVKDANLRLDLQKTLSPKNPATQAILKAPALIVLCGKLNTSGYYNNLPLSQLGDWFMYDLGLATQSLCLLAHDLGLGSVIIGAFDQKQAKDVLKVPDDYEIAVMISMGYPAQSPKAPKRKDIDKFIHLNKF